MNTVAAVVTSYNRSDFIVRCLQSLLDSADDTMDIRILVMDNGSTDGSPEVAQSFGEKVLVEHTKENLPINAVINRGIRRALSEFNPDFLITMNEDTEFRPGALAILVREASNHPNALLSPLMLDYRRPERIDPLALFLAQKATGLVEDALSGRPIQPTYPVGLIIGAGMLAAQQVWRRLGEMDELFNFYGADDDYGFRALHHGYQLLLVPQAHLLHAHGNFNPEVRAKNLRSEHRIWKLKAQMRYMTILKNPQTNYRRCLVRFIKKFVLDQIDYLFSLSPRKMLLSTSAFWDCVIKLRKVAKVRNDHFSQSRRAR